LVDRPTEGQLGEGVVIDAAAEHRACDAAEGSKIELLDLIAAEQLALEEADLVGSDTADGTVARRVELAARVASMIEASLGIEIKRRREPQAGATNAGIGDAIGRRRRRAGIV
jgi:hypothetical protein